MRGIYDRTPEIRQKMREGVLHYLKDHKPAFSGKKHSLQAKKKISESRLAYYRNLKKSGKPNPLIGRKHSKKQNHEHSLAMKGRFAKTKHWHWKGGRKTSMGYIYVLAPGHPGANSFGYVREHRLIMEKMIGRLLKPSEVVHHKNRDKTDNRPENLILFGNHKDHSDFRESQKVCPHCGGRL